MKEPCLANGLNGKFKFYILISVNTLIVFFISIAYYTCTHFDFCNNFYYCAFIIISRIIMCRGD